MPEKREVEVDFMSRRRYDPIDEEKPARDRPPGPYGGKPPIKVSLALYLVSLLVVILAVFIIMMVQYFPGYHTNYKLTQAVKGADYVYIGIRIPKEELLKRKINPLTEEIEVAKILKSMGAKTAKCEINPDRTKLPLEK